VAVTASSLGPLLLMGLAAAQLPGVKPGIALAATLTCIQENPGLVSETLLAGVPGKLTLVSMSVNKGCSRACSREESFSVWMMVSRKSGWTGIQPKDLGAVLSQPR
jgi:hypothetical protein